MPSTETSPARPNRKLPVRGHRSDRSSWSARDHCPSENVPAAQIVALARTSAKAAELAAKGVVIREADYDRPETLAPALSGVKAVADLGQSAWCQGAAA